MTPMLSRLRPRTRASTAALVALVAIACFATAHAHAHGAHGAHGGEIAGFSAREVLHAMAASALVSLASLAACALFPLRAVMVDMEALSHVAIGAMAAEALGHQLPSAYGSASSTVVASGVVTGVLMFHIVECVVRATRGDDGKETKPASANGVGRGRAPRRRASKSSSRSTSMRTAVKGTSFAHVAPTGWLNLIADAVHNFTDGVAIAAAFARRGVPAGWRTAIAVLAHELPQEIGDFSILRVAGFTDFQALGFNLLSATVAIAGTALTFMLLALSQSNVGIGVVSRGVSASTGTSAAFAEAFAAGGFLAVIFAALADIARQKQTNMSNTARARVIIGPTLRVLLGFTASIVLERHLHVGGSSHDSHHHHHHHHHH